MADARGGLSTLADHDALWNKIQARRCKVEQERLAPPWVRLWDGDYRLRGEVAGWRAIDYEFIENDTGTASLKLSLDHYLAKWVMDFRGRAKRNVHVTIDKQGSRWSGFMDHYRVVREKGGDAYLEIIFKHDYEQAKHILCWSNPFLRPELQFPKLWVVFGPAKWCLLLTLFVNLLRLETSLWTLPDNPLDINEWMPFSFNPGTWRNIVKPFPLLGDNSNLTIVFSRFKTWHDVAQKVLQDAQLTVVTRRYLDGDPHPFSNLTGELDMVWAEDLFSLIPIRHGCLVWDIVDNSAWGTETAFGGSLLTGLIRAVVNIASDGYTEGVDVFTGDPTYPGQYYTPWFLGTSPQAPWVVFEEGPLTGIESSEFQYFEATDTSFVTGGHSMPGINEGISAGVNMAGDFVTSLINSAMAAGGAFGTAIDLPPLGGAMDAVAKILYEDVFLAFMEIPTLRAAGLSLPLPGLENIITGLGDFHLYEGWADGADRGFTLSALMAIRAKIWATRAHSSHTITVADAAPYIVGEGGHGHFWLGNRVGTTVLGFPIPETVFVERVSRIGYGWDENGSKGWRLTIGYREPEDPALKALDWIREINSGLGSMGVL
ncbi:minor tail protein [Mycobacterium phage MyraDee]|uniref:Minor tail protein n=1 Tax=Mycobacterium phage MyraDee TaxID=2024303 RepID=A0A222YYY8_9CAUD|nr:minor tail protein [Mycobacterium phage MyraDee]ASR77133.1 minor tail protein [Mycobacterium phage MyraDee]